MSDSRKHKDYVVIAILHESEKLNVKLSYKGENTLENLYIINEFVYNEENMHFFKILFNFFNSKNKSADFTDFFVYKDKFYAIFKYHQAADLNLKFQKDLITATFDERCFLLENILIRIEKYYKEPIEFIGCLSQPENINVSEDRDVYFSYNFKDMEKYSDKTMDSVFENIHDIIFKLLRPEAEMQFNKQLHIVLKKCKNAVYGSIPELVVDLKRAEKNSKSNSWLTYIKQVFNLYKKEISRYSKTAVAALMVMAGVYIGYLKLTEGNNINPAALITIGPINYTANTEDTSDKKLTSEDAVEGDQENTESDKSKNSSDLTLSEGLDMKFEDYIVQYNDTIPTISMDYYNDEKFSTAVASFNGLEVNSKLTAGSILKMPNRTEVALYTTK